MAALLSFPIASMLSSCTDGGTSTLRGSNDISSAKLLDTFRTSGDCGLAADAVASAACGDLRHRSAAPLLVELGESPEIDFPGVCFATLPCEAAACGDAADMDQVEAGAAFVEPGGVAELIITAGLTDDLLPGVIAADVIGASKVCNEITGAFRTRYSVDTGGL